MLNPHSLQFLGYENLYSDWDKARYAVLPIPYEGAVSFGTGTAAAPDAVLHASPYLELWDEVFHIDASQAGIATLAPTPLSADHADMHEIIYEHTKEIVRADKIPIIIGGDHSVSSGVFRALTEKYTTLSCVQIDAHADLRNSYEGSTFSHASVMARIRDMTDFAVQIGIRSMSQQEAEWIAREKLAVCTMHQFRKNLMDWKTAIDQLPEPVYITFDVDAFDWSVIASTGTPEPGGLSWDEAMALLSRIFSSKNVVGWDVVELAVSPHDRNSSFAVAKLIYKMIAMHVTANF
jgi:agmatinase